MTTSSRILVIGYCYPPTASPEAFVTAKLLKNIPDCTIDVLTLEDGLVSDFCDPEMGKYAAGINGEVFKTSPTTIVKTLCRIPRLPLRPDRWLLANRFIYNDAVKLLAKKYDCLVTRSQYHSAHLVGLKLKKRFPDLPWIACFSDPWSESDHQLKLPLFSNWSRRQERKVLGAADHLVFPTEGLLEHVTKENITVSEKSSVIPHCYAMDLYTPQTRTSDKSLEPACNTLHWRIFGSFYGNRQPDIVLQALDKIEIPRAKRLSVEIFGSHHDKYNEFEAFNRNHGDRMISYKGQISHRKALDLMQASDLLIVVDSTDHKESFYLPSKIIDYFGSGAKTLSICRPGTVEKITKERGDTTANIDSLTSICSAMERILEDDSPAQPQTTSTSPFEAHTVGSNFRLLIKQITQNKTK